ncbi:MAG: ADP-ribose pyrophosphatase [Chlamydiia bacterium]|nr:ADP-ribose pyrophosphatase [Chlamydiia bacterium]
MPDNEGSKDQSTFWQDEMRKCQVEIIPKYMGNIIQTETRYYMLPDGRSRGPYEVVHHTGGCIIIPIDSQGRIHFVKQYRFVVDEILIELPAGKLDEGEEPESCAARELVEETGYKANKLDLVQTAYASPGFTDEKLYFFFAEDLVPCHIEGDDADHIDRLQMSLEEALEKVRAGEIVDAKTIIGIQLYERLLKEKNNGQ